MVSLLDLSSGVPDAEWLGSRNVVSNYVAPKGDSGNDVFSIARGAGRQGNDCLLVTSPDAKAGLPGFWIIRAKGNGKGLVSGISNADAYLAAGQQVNRLSFWLRFDAGFRAKSSTSAAQNLHVGTYHHDPAKPGVKKESDNWHFYHQLLLRHDLAKGNWVHVVVNELPTHQRGLSNGFPVYNPTSPAGNYWEIATRFYIDLHPYFSDPEISYPVKMWVDDIRLEYSDPFAQVTASIVQSPASVAVGQPSRYPVTLVNHTPNAIGGVIAHRSRYGWRPDLLDKSAQRSVHKQRVVLQPGANDFELVINVKDGAKPGMSMRHGVLFVPDSESRPNNSSHADSNVRIASGYQLTGPSDCSPVHASVRLTVA